MHLAIPVSLSSWTIPVLAANVALITQSNNIPRDSSCLQSGYYGKYGRPVQSVYLVDQACLSQAAQFLDSGHVISISDHDQARLVWLQRAAVDSSLQQPVPLTELLGNTLRKCSGLEDCYLLEQDHSFDRDGQYTISVPPPSALQLLWASDSSALVAVPTSYLPTLDIHLPQYVKPTVLPLTPLPTAPIDEHAIQHLRSVLAKLVFNPSVASIVSSLSRVKMGMDIRHLTGESDGRILSRHSFSQGARDAADWIQDQLEQTGAECEQRAFLEGFAPNVICRYLGSTNSSGTGILSAHYDSRGSFGSLRAPGADDDGSGVIHLLAIARVIKEKKIKFGQNFEIVAFAGEEQGLLGSRAYAKELRGLNANITLHIQADMLGYHSPLEPLQLGLPEFIGLTEAGWLVGNVSKVYAPELTVGYTPACCSDHQSFNEQGFPATQVFERAGPILDPMYHNTGDLSNRTGYDFVQVESIAKVTFATMLEVLGFEITGDEE